MRILEQGAVALTAALLLATVQDAEAARLQIVSTGTAVDVLDHTTSINTTSVTRQLTGGLIDGSGVDTVLLSDFQSFGPTPQGPAAVEDGYSHLVAVDASGASTSLNLTASHHWTASTTTPANLDSHRLTQSLSLDGLRLRIVGDAGEAVGQAVSVSFQGQADALLTGLADINHLGLTLDVMQGTNTLASYNGLWTDGTSEAVNLSFQGLVGDEFTVSMSAFQSREGFWQPLVGQTEISGDLMLQGHFAVTAVPEPETWGLALAGLMVLAGKARQRRR